MSDAYTALLTVGVVALVLWWKNRDPTRQRPQPPIISTTNSPMQRTPHDAQFRAEENLASWLQVPNSPGAMVERQETLGQNVPEEFRYSDTTLAGLLNEISSIDARDLMVTNNVEQRTTKNLQAETYAYQKAPRTEPPVRPAVGQYSDCDSRRIVATFRPGLEESPSVYQRGSKNFAYARAQVELDELSANPTVSGQYEWGDDRFEPYIGAREGLQSERSDSQRTTTGEQWGPDDVRKYLAANYKQAPNGSSRRSGFLGEPGFQVDAVESKILPSVAKKGERDFSLDFFNNVMDIRDMHKNMGATGDNLLFNRMKYVGIQPQIAKDIRARWNVNGLKPFVEEELRAQANKIWWENDDLDVYM